MNGIKKSVMVTLLVTRGVKTTDACNYVARMSDMTEDECMVALRMIGLDRQDAMVLLNDTIEIHDAFMAQFDTPKATRKVARKVSVNRALVDAVIDPRD